ncbi:MAG TPA: GNAT family N-acetyltransferase, partial [Anaerolineales bacterium]
MTGPKLDLLCRPATEGDTPAMLELTSTIWDGEDYVPLVWAAWLGDPHGRLAVAEIASGEQAGRVVGLGKLTCLGPSDWWMEGLRTHPQFEGRGVASALHAYLVDAWLRFGGGTLRLATSSKRFAVHHLSERSGFSRIGEFSSFQAAPSEPDRRRFRALSLPEAPAALDYARRSPSLALSSGLIDLGWQWMAPDLAQVETAARGGMAWWWQPGQASGQGLLLLSED